MVLLFWVLNFVISWLNAWGCGKSWTETKAYGKGPHFLNWCGAIMSAVGFTWCYMVILAFFGATLPFEHEVHGHIVNKPYLDEAALTAFVQLGYLVIVLPLLGSGLAITVHSWSYFWRNRTFGSGGVTAWNTFAMGSNIYSAVVEVPKAARGVWGYFFKGDSDGKVKTLILLLVVLSVCAGVLTTYTILTMTQRATARDRQLKYENAT